MVIQKKQDIEYLQRAIIEVENLIYSDLLVAKHYEGLHSDFEIEFSRAFLAKNFFVSEKIVDQLTHENELGIYNLKINHVAIENIDSNLINTKEIVKQEIEKFILG